MELTINKNDNHIHHIQDKKFWYYFHPILLPIKNKWGKDE
jgi:hypothetical protein